MNGKLWFGIPGSHMQWVPCPSVDSSIQRNRYVQRLQFENGGGDARRSAQYQTQYDFSFSGPAHEVEGIDAFHKFASGFYGDGLIYLAHPVDYETNLFPAAWASPGLIEQGWANIATSTPTFGATNVSSYAQPQRTATWNVTDQAGTYTKSTIIVIPPTHTLNVGVSGLATGTGVVRARPINTDGSYAAVEDLTLLSKSGSTRMNTTFDGSEFQAVEFYVTREDSKNFTYTNLVTNPSFESSESSEVTARTNLVKNPSFEVNTNTWSNFLTSSISRVTSEFYVGLACARVFCASIDDAIVSENIGVTGGQTYTLSAWVKGEAGKRVGLNIFEVSPQKFNAKSFIMTGDWQRIEHSATLTEGVVNIRADVRNNTNGSHIFFVDAVQFEAGSTASPYFDGSTSAAGDFTYAWSGTAHASTSVQRGVGVTGVIPGSSQGISSSEWASTGSKAVRIIPTSSTSNSSQVTIGVNTEAGKTYTVMAKIRLGAALTGSLWSLARRVLVYDNPIANLLAQSAQASNAAGETVLSTTFTATTAVSNIRLTNGASAGNGDVWWDDFIVVEGEYDGEYFDGNTIATDSFNFYQWTGVPDASTSIRIWKDTSTVSVTSMIARLYKSTVTPSLPSDHYEGKGSTGLMFVDDAIVDNYTYMFPPRKGISTTLVEVGAWR